MIVVPRLYSDMSQFNFLCAHRLSARSGITCLWGPAPRIGDKSPPCSKRASRFQLSGKR